MNFKKDIESIAADIKNNDPVYLSKLASVVDNTKRLTPNDNTAGTTSSARSMLSKYVGSVKESISSGLTASDAIKENETLRSRVYSKVLYTPLLQALSSLSSTSLRGSLIKDDSILDVFNFIEGISDDQSIDLENKSANAGKTGFDSILDVILPHNKDPETGARKELIDPDDYPKGFTPLSPEEQKELILPNYKAKEFDTKLPGKASDIEKALALRSIYEETHKRLLSLEAGAKDSNITAVKAYSEAVLAAVLGEDDSCIKPGLEGSQELTEKAPKVNYSIKDAQIIFYAPQWIWLMESFARANGVDLQGLVRKAGGKIRETESAQMLEGTLKRMTNPVGGGGSSQAYGFLNDFLKRNDTSEQGLIEAVRAWVDKEYSKKFRDNDTASENLLQLRVKLKRLYSLSESTYEELTSAHGEASALAKDLLAVMEKLNATSSDEQEQVRGALEAVSQQGRVLTHKEAVARATDIYGQITGEKPIDESNGVISSIDGRTYWAARGVTSMQSALLYVFRTEAIPSDFDPAKKAIPAISKTDTTLLEEDLENIVSLLGASIRDAYDTDTGANYSSEEPGATPDRRSVRSAVLSALSNNVLRSENRQELLSESYKGAELKKAKQLISVSGKVSSGIYPLKTSEITVDKVTDLINKALLGYKETSYVDVKDGMTVEQLLESSGIGEAYPKKADGSIDLSKIMIRPRRVMKSSRYLLAYKGEEATPQGFYDGIYKGLTLDAKGNPKKNVNPEAIKDMLDGIALQISPRDLVVGVPPKGKNLLDASTRNTIEVHTEFDKPVDLETAFSNLEQYDPCLQEDGKAVPPKDVVAHCEVGGVLKSFTAKKLDGESGLKGKLFAALNTDEDVDGSWSGDVSKERKGLENDAFITSVLSAGKLSRAAEAKLDAYRKILQEKTGDSLNPIDEARKVAAPDTVDVAKNRKDLVALRSKKFAETSKIILDSLVETLGDSEKEESFRKMAESSLISSKPKDGEPQTEWDSAVASRAKEIQASNSLEVKPEFREFLKDNQFSFIQKVLVAGDTFRGDVEAAKASEHNYAHKVVVNKLSIENAYTKKGYEFHQKERTEAGEYNQNNVQTKKPKFSPVQRGAGSSSFRVLNPKGVEVCSETSAKGFLYGPLSAAIKRVETLMKVDAYKTASELLGTLPEKVRTSLPQLTSLITDKSGNTEEVEGLIETALRRGYYAGKSYVTLGGKYFEVKFGDVTPVPESIRADLIGADGAGTASEKEKVDAEHDYFLEEASKIYKGGLEPLFSYCKFFPAGNAFMPLGGNLEKLGDSGTSQDPKQKARMTVSLKSGDYVNPMGIRLDLPAGDYQLRMENPIELSQYDLDTKTPETVYNRDVGKTDEDGNTIEPSFESTSQGAGRPNINLAAEAIVKEVSLLRTSNGEFIVENKGKKVPGRPSYIRDSLSEVVDLQESAQALLNTIRNQSDEDRLYLDGIREKSIEIVKGLRSIFGKKAYRAIQATARIAAAISVERSRAKGYSEGVREPLEKTAAHGMAPIKTLSVYTKGLHAYVALVKKLNKTEEKVQADGNKNNAVGISFAAVAGTKGTKASPELLAAADQILSKADRAYITPETPMELFSSELTTARFISTFVSFLTVDQEGSEALAAKAASKIGQTKSRIFKDCFGVTPGTDLEEYIEQNLGDPSRDAGKIAGIIREACDFVVTSGKPGEKVQGSFGLGKAPTIGVKAFASSPRSAVEELANYFEGYKLKCEGLASRIGVKAQPKTPGSDKIASLIEGSTHLTQALKGAGAGEKLDLDVLATENRDAPNALITLLESAGYPNLAVQSFPEVERELVGKGVPSDDKGAAQAIGALASGICPDNASRDIVVQDIASFLGTGHLDTVEGMIPQNQGTTSGTKVKSDGFKYSYHRLFNNAKSTPEKLRVLKLVVDSVSKLAEHYDGTTVDDIEDNTQYKEAMKCVDILSNGGVGIDEKEFISREKEYVKAIEALDNTHGYGLPDLITYGVSAGVEKNPNAYLSLINRGVKRKVLNLQSLFKIPQVSPDKGSDKVANEFEKLAETLSNHAVSIRDVLAAGDVKRLYKQMEDYSNGKILYRSNDARSLAGLSEVVNSSVLNFFADRVKGLTNRLQIVKANLLKVDRNRNDAHGVLQTSRSNLVKTQRSLLLAIRATAGLGGKLPRSIMDTLKKASEDTKIGKYDPKHDAVLEQAANIVNKAVNASMNKVLELVALMDSLRARVINHLVDLGNTEVEYLKKQELFKSSGAIDSSMNRVRNYLEKYANKPSVDVGRADDAAVMEQRALYNICVRMGSGVKEVDDNASRLIKVEIAMDLYASLRSSFNLLFKADDTISDSGLDAFEEAMKADTGSMLYKKAQAAGMTGLSDSLKDLKFRIQEIKSKSEGHPQMAKKVAELVSTQTKLMEMRADIYRETYGLKALTKAVSQVTGELSTGISALSMTYAKEKGYDFCKKTGDVIGLKEVTKSESKPSTGDAYGKALAAAKLEVDAALRGVSPEAPPETSKTAVTLLDRIKKALSLNK